MKLTKEDLNEVMDSLGPHGAYKDRRYVACVGGCGQMGSPEEYDRHIVYKAAPFLIAKALRKVADELQETVCGDYYVPDYCETCRTVENLRQEADYLDGGENDD